MDQYPFFKDRTEAGKKLALALEYLKNERLVVVAIPNGGIPIGIEVSQKFTCPLEMVFVHKLYPPDHPEIGFGAISLDGSVTLNDEAINQLELSRVEVENLIDNTFLALKKRTSHLTPPTPTSLTLKTVILVDDGLSSGYTMLTALHATKKENPKQIIVALPTASDQGLELIKKEIKEVTSLYLHPKNLPFDISASYQNWQVISDEEGEKLLTQFWLRRPPYAAESKLDKK